MKKKSLLTILLCILLLGPMSQIVTATNCQNNDENTDDEETNLFGRVTISITGKGSFDSFTRSNIYLPVLRLGPYVLFYVYWDASYGGSCVIDGKSYYSDAKIWVWGFMGFIYAGISGDPFKPGCAGKLFIVGTGKVTIE